MMSILFIGKEGDNYAKIAAEYTKAIFPETIVVWGKRGDKFPAFLKEWHGDYVLSYLSQWIIPEWLLKKAKKASINWHPGPPSYPGIGCTNFAIYNDEKEFGITCHHMNRKVDAGNIIEVKKFNILPNDTVFSITQKCYAQILTSYQSVLEQIALENPLPISDEYWTRKPYTRKELNALCRLDVEMGTEEMKRRIRATKYDRHWAYLEINEMKFFYKEDS